MFGWIKKKGQDSANFGKKVVGADEIKESVENIKHMAETVLSPKKLIQNAKTESFVEARMRLKITDEDLLKNYRNFSYIFYASLFFALLCLVFTFYNLFVKQQIMPSLATLAIFLLCLANCFKFSFRSFQIKHQKLSSVKDWWERSNEWFPSIKN